MSRASAAAWLLSCATLLTGVGAPQSARAAEDHLERGKAAFTHRCALCHREGQTGAFILARRLGKEKSLLEQRSDLQPAYIRQVVRSGLVNMPRISRVELPDPDLDAVIAYLASARPAPKATP